MVSPPSTATRAAATQDHPDTPLDFAGVFQAHQRPIYNYLLRLTQNPAEADDLTQEVFVRVYRSLSTFRGDSSLKTWLYRIASNVFLDHARRASTRLAGVTLPLEEAPGGDDGWADAAAPQPEQLAAQTEMSACVQAFVKTLPESYRVVLVLHDLQGSKNREIAEILGCSLATVKIRLHRAREKLRAALNAGCDFAHDERNVFVCEPKEERES